MAKPRRITRRAAVLGMGTLGLATVVPLRTSAQSEVPAFALSAGDITDIRDLGGRLHIALNGQASTRFTNFTSENLGRLVRVTAGDVILIEAVVRVVIDSGLLSTVALDAETRDRTRRLLIGH